MTDFLNNVLNEFKLPLSNPVPIFFLILLIILVSPNLLHRFKIPGIIGLIISGVIIGPYGLGILEKNLAIDLFATIGLLYIMFIAGLDLDLNEFLANRKKSLLFGIFTFIVPLGIGFPIAYYLFNYDLNASLLTASLFSTHTLVAYPIVSKFGVAKNQSVAITVGGTIFTDTAVLLLLAVVLGNKHGSLDKVFWISLGISLIVFTAIMFYLVPKIAKWFFQKFESEKHSHYIFVLSVVFFAAFLSQLTGLEPIIGAFISGLALNRLIPHSSALMNRIEFLGNSLFIPFFLISVGMVVDLSVLLKGPIALLIAGALLITAFSTKWLAASLTQLIFRYTKTQRNLIFGLSSSHAAAALAVILVGYKAGILDENVLNGTIILILVSCIVASFVTEKAAKQIVITTENGTNSSSSSEIFNYEHILVPVANLINFEKQIEFALLIKDIKSANPVSILSIVPNNEEAEQNILKSRNMLEKYAKQAAATEVKVNLIATIDHNAASGIARISREIMADIIVLGWPKRTGILDKIVGEKMESIISNVDKNLFISQFVNPLITHHRMILISPPLAEKESGFEIWLQKLVRMSYELSLPIIHYGDPKTQETIRKQIKKRNLNVSITYHPFHDWEDFMILSSIIHQDDLIVLVSARKGYISYMNVLDNLPSKLERYFDKNSKMIIYPQQLIHKNINEGFNDISSQSISKGIEAIGQVGKEIAYIFKKNKEE